MHIYSTAHPPVVEIKPKELTVKIGEQAEFNCSATGVGANNFKYQWFLNNRAIDGKNTSTLVIDPDSVDDTGDYTCSVTNEYGGFVQSKVATLYLGI